MLSIAICDDEEYFRTTEKKLISKYMAGKNCECMIDMYESGKELLALRSAISQYNIIFLDVNMEEIDGIETAKEIRKISKDVFIVFVTAFITYALEGYKVDAVRYLIKDHESLEKAMTECMDTILDKMDYEENEMTFDFQEDAVHYTIYMKLDDIAELLPNKDFCRIHKSYLVNLKYVESVERYRAVLSNGKSLAISKARFLDTRNEFACYRGEI